MKLQADLVLRHPLARQPCQVDRLLAFFDMLLCCAALVVEPDDPVWFHWQVGDNKADAGEQLAGMPFQLGDDTTRFVLRCRLILEAALDAIKAFWHLNLFFVQHVQKRAALICIAP